jgi:hypothetical protein
MILLFSEQVWVIGYAAVIGKQGIITYVTVNSSLVYLLNALRG